MIILILSSRDSGSQDAAVIQDPVVKLRDDIGLLCIDIKLPLNI